MTGMITNYLELLWFYLGPFIEIGILAFMIYYALSYFSGTRSANILAGIVFAMILLYLITLNLKLRVLSSLLDQLWVIFPLGIVIIFQPELRRGFAQLGARPFAKRIRREESISEVVSAVRNLSVLRIGSLIVFQRQVGMRALISNGVVIESNVNAALIRTIFHPNTPLHDGGIAIVEDKIVAAHIIFPLTQNQSVTSALGTRHRAAIGITEETDAVAVVVSEETGIISIACHGSIKRNLSPDKLSRYLHALLISEKDEQGKPAFDSGNEESEFAFSGKEQGTNE